MLHCRRHQVPPRSWPINYQPSTINRRGGGLSHIPGFPAGDYSASCSHRREVEWHDCTGWKRPVEEGLRTTIYRLKEEDEILLEAERCLLGPPLKNLPAPFNQFFASFEEANQGFSLLADTLKPLGVDPAEYQKDKRICLSLAGDRKSGDRLLLNVPSFAASLHQSAYRR